MKNKSKIGNLVKLNPFSLDKININKRKPIIIKNTNINYNNPKLKSLSKNKILNDNLEKKFFNKTFSEHKKNNLFITKSNSQKKSFSFSAKEISDDIIRVVEKQLKLINSEEHIKNIVKILEIFRKELIHQLEAEYNENKINNILKENFENIIQYLAKFFSFYENKYSNCIISLRKIIKDLTLKMSNKSLDNIRYNTSENSSQIINNYTHNNNNIIIFDENKKKHFLNEEENIVNLINSLSSNIRISNKKYKSSLLNIANLIDFSNNKLIEMKNKLESMNTNIISKYNLNSKYLHESISDIDSIYSLNINLIQEVKILDDNQKTFFEKAKEIFNNLKINHKIKIKEYQKLFDSIQNIQSGNDSKSKENSINCYYTINNLSLCKNNKNKKFHNYYNIKGKRGKSLPSEIKSKINELKYFKLNLNNINNNKRTRNMNNFLNETDISYNNKSSNSYNMTNSFNSNNNITTNTNSFNTTNIVQNNNIFSIKDKNNDLNKSSFTIKSEQNNHENNLLHLAELMMEFINKMNNLQKSIINKRPNISQQKKDFEIFKKQLIEYIQTIINKNMNSNKKIIKNDNNNSNNKISNFLYNNIINEKSSDNIINNQNTISNYYFKNDKLQIIHNDEYIILTKNNSKNNDAQDIIFKLEKKNKELILELEKLKENNKNIIFDKNENESLKKSISKFIDLINNLLKEENIDSQNDKNIKINSNKEEIKIENNDNNNLDIEYISNLINKFQEYNNNLKIKLKKLNEEKEKLLRESNENLQQLEKYKKNLDEKSNINDEKENLNNKINNIFDEEEKNNNQKSKTSLNFDIEGDLSFKGESSIKNINNLINNNSEDNIKYTSSLDNNTNTTGSFANINSNLNKLNNNNSKNSSDMKNLNNNDLVEDNDKILENKKNEINDIEGHLDINKEILKFQNNLKNKIKSLEEEVQTEKNKNLNFFIEIKNDLCEFNEEKVPISKYTNLVNLYEKEQETNKILEKKYINYIENINNNLIKYYKKMNCELEIGNIQNNIITISTDENNGNNILGNNLNIKENKNNLNKDNNLHFDYSNMKKAISILEIDDINFESKNSNKNSKIKSLIEENNSLKKNEKLLLEQLNSIKSEIKEYKSIIKEKDEKIKGLNLTLERQTLLQKDNLYIPLRNGLELLITEINLTNKIKDILRVLLNISLYNKDEIEKIFKYKEKKKNIIGIFKF